MKQDMGIESAGKWVQVEEELNFDGVEEECDNTGTGARQNAHVLSPRSLFAYVLSPRSLFAYVKMPEWALLERMQF